MKAKAVEEKVYEVCKNGCAYSEVDTVFTELNSLGNNNQYNVVINIRDQGTYILNETCDLSMVE